MTIVRAYLPTDAIHLTALYQRSVRELGSRDYSPAQVAVWAALAPSPERLEALSRDGRIRLVSANADDIPLAFADLERNGHIDFFYCAPEAAGKGVATRLFVALEEAARGSGIRHIYAEASERAKPFFEKQGFAVISRRDFAVDGVSIHNYEVRKSLRV